MDPCPFVRILIGDLALKFAAGTKPSPPASGGVGVHPSSSPCFCKVKLKGFPTQTASVPDLTSADAAEAASARSLAASFSLDKAQIDAVAAAKPRIKISVFAGRGGGGCGLVGAGNAKLIGKVVVPVDLSVAQSKPCIFHNGWVSIGDQREKKKSSASSSSSSSQLNLCVRAEPDPRFVFRFDGEPECSPQVFQVQGNVKQPVFTCKFGFRSNSDLKNSSMSETSTSRSWISSLKSNKENHSKERKGWSITIHDLSGSPVAVASMVTPFVASPGSDRVSRANPGAWLILRPGDATWKPWGRLEAWRERGGTESVGYKFELLTDSTAAPTTLAGGTVGASGAGKFIIDVTSSLVSPMNSPQSSFDFGSGSRSRPGSGSGSDFGFSPYRGFVMSSTVNRPEVEVGVQHVTCSEDAAAFVAVAAAMDLSMDACRLFSEKLPKELRH